MPLFEVILVCVFLNADWIRRGVLIPNAGKRGSENSEYGHFSHSLTDTFYTVSYFQSLPWEIFSLETHSDCLSISAISENSNMSSYEKSQFIEKPWLGNLMYKKRNLLVMLKLMSHHRDLGHCKKRWRKAKM